MERRGDSWAAYWLWCLIGAGLGLGVLSILTVGPFVLLVTLTLCGWLLWRLDFGWGMLGLLSGAALPVLYVAWSDRASDRWSPWLLVVTALVLAAAGAVAFQRYRRT